VFSQKQEALDISTDVIVLVDISGSMSGREIIDATNATAGFAQVLQDLQAKYGILAFSSNLHWVKRLNARYSTSEILQKISTLQVEGSTMMHQAILEASYSLSGSKNKAIILITDGSPSDYLQGKNDVPALLKVCEKHGIKSYTILIQMQYHLKAFQDAKLPAVNVNSTEELPAAMMNIVQELYS
jgi:Mg-chelatase subunit ChlD